MPLLLNRLHSQLSSARPDHTANKVFFGCLSVALNLHSCFPKPFPQTNTHAQIICGCRALARLAADVWRCSCHELILMAVACGKLGPQVSSGVFWLLHMEANYLQTVKADPVTEHVHAI